MNYTIIHLQEIFLFNMQKLFRNINRHVDISSLKNNIRFCCHYTITETIPSDCSTMIMYNVHTCMYVYRRVQRHQELLL